ncbi:lateral signaling target protein 2 homolog [Leptopilina heterotoma]|uniref:lateral signaling target protein 2 homolog n=1 Tax=Leptopilina heterotoma TaxID=63436 RepID=UPI001CA7D97D|nr:lateral signaling target protein 2 homolog [Leptopilina heterotoma]
MGDIIAKTGWEYPITPPSSPEPDEQVNFDGPVPQEIPEDELELENQDEGFQVIGPNAQNHLEEAQVDDPPPQVYPWRQPQSPPLVEEGNLSPSYEQEIVELEPHSSQVKSPMEERHQTPILGNCKSFSDKASDIHHRHRHRHNHHKHHHHRHRHNHHKQHKKHHKKYHHNHHHRHHHIHHHRHRHGDVSTMKLQK